MRIGFIGCGNMAKAMISGLVKNEIVPSTNIFVSDTHQENLDFVKQNYNVSTTKNNNDLVVAVDYLILAIKPQYYESLIKEISPILDKQVLISIAPGKSLATLLSFTNDKTPIIRTMPNTPAMVNEAMSAVCANEYVSKQQLENTLQIFNSFGKAQVISENLMDAFVGVAGSSPAYIFILIEAMADAALADGIPRAQAYEFAAQAVLGSAKMVLETNLHPAQLKDMVCSPGGTTIEAVRTLEKTGFRSSIIEAMKSCVKKAKEM